MYLDDDEWSGDDDDVDVRPDDDEYSDLERDDGADIGRAPICPSCGVTALPTHLSNVLDSEFACDNEGCDAYGETV